MAASFLRIKVKGVNLDTLINSIYNLGITLRNIARKEHKEICFNIQSDDFAKIKDSIFKNADYEIVKETGIPNFKILLKKYAFVVVTFAVCVMLFIFSTTFIWDIKIYGIENISRQDVIAALGKNNVKIGNVYLYDNDKLEKILLNEIKDIAQVSVDKQGNLLLINISEKIRYKEPDFEPVLSQFYGIITECKLISGTLCVKAGDYVNAGDVLVQPYILDANGNQVKVEPIAEIKAKVYIVGQTALEKEEIVFVRSGKKNVQCDFYLFGKKIFSNKARNRFANFETNVYNKYISSLIPIICRRTEIYELVPKKVINNLELEQSKAEQKARELAYGQIKNLSSVMDESCNSEIINDILYANCVLTCEIYLT